MSERLRNFYRTILLVALFWLPAFSYASALTVAISSAPSNLSPFFSTDANSQNINRLVHSSLIDFDRSMNVVCLLCQSFNESLSEDGKYIISFKLKEGLKFHDGSRVSSKDIQNAWKLYTETEKIKSIFRFAFGNIKEVRIKDDQKFDLVYESFAPDHLSNLVLFKILKLNKEESLEVKDLIGVSSFTYSAIEPLRILLKSNHPTVPDLDFKVVKDETTLALKLINKEIDLSIVTMSPRKVEWLRKNQKNLKFFETEGTIYNYLALNHERFPTSEKKFRKALSALIPRQKLKEFKFKGAITLANSMFSKAFKELQLDLDIDPYNPKLAAELFKELGFEKKNGKWTYKKEPITLDWKVSNNKATIEVVNLLKNELEKEGISVHLTLLEWGTFMGSFKRGDFDILMSRWVGFTGPEMLNYVFSSKSFPPKGGNRGHFQNAEIDKLLDLGQSTWKKEQRVAIYKQALRKIDEEYPYISLWYPRIIWIGRKCIKKLDPYPSESFMAFLELESACE